MFMQKMVGPSPRVYCFLAQPTNNSRDITQWLNENIAIGCFSENTKHRPLMNRHFLQKSRQKHVCIEFLNFLIRLCADLVG
jgi:hypothetical protein